MLKRKCDTCKKEKVFDVDYLSDIKNDSWIVGLTVCGSLHCNECSEVIKEEKLAGKNYAT